jgi:hypothetical protein
MPPWVGLTLMAVTCGAAFWKGGREEQLAAAGILLSWVATVLLRDPQWQGTQWGAFGADTLNLLLICAIALRSPRYWPLVGAALQLLCVLTHVARTVDPHVRGWAYATGQVIFTQLYLLTILFAVWTTWRAGRQLAASTPSPTADPGATRR